MELREKIRILSDAAKYDVSCSSSGSNRKIIRDLGMQATVEFATLGQKMGGASPY